MKKKWRLILGAAFLLAVLGFVIFQVVQEEQVDVKRVEPSNIKRSFTENGEVRPREERNVFSMFPGRIETLLVEEGDRVEEGDLLAVLDDEEFKYSLAEIEAQLQGLRGEEMQLGEEPGPAETEKMRLNIEQAESYLETAEDDYQRMEHLFEQGAVSEQELQEAEERIEEAQYNLASQQKALEVLHESYLPPKGSREVLEARRAALLSQKELIKYKRDNYKIHAPISGTAAKLEVEEKGLVSPQAPMLTLFQSKNLIVETMVLTQDIFELSEGMGVTLTLELRDEDLEFPGEITAISSYAEKGVSALGLEEERVKVTVEPSIPRDLELAPGYRLEVEFTMQELSDKLVVPQTALFTSEGEDALLVVEDGSTELRPVTTGLETRQEVVIEKGIEKGELVLVNPQAEGIDEGSRVSYRLVNE